MAKDISDKSSNEYVFAALVPIHKKLSEKLVSQKLLLTLRAKIVMANTRLRGKDMNKNLFVSIHLIQ